MKPNRLNQINLWIENHHRKVLAIILILSVLVRAGAAVYLGNVVVDMPGTTDQLSYHNLAIRLLDGKGFTFDRPWWPATPAGAPTAHWSYLYTFYLTAVYGLFGVAPLAGRLIQVLVVGILQPLLLYGIASRVFNRRIGLVSAALMAGYTYWIYYDAALMTEPFYLTAILGLILLLIRFTDPQFVSLQPRRQIGIALLIGLVAGATILLRQVFLTVLPFMLLWALWRRRKMFWITIWQLGIAGLVILAMIAPFTIYNYARFNRFVLLNTNAGFAFFWANHPVYGTQFEGILSPEKGNYLELLPKDIIHLSEAELDSELLKRGMQFVFDDPGRYALLSLSRIPIFFEFWPTATSSIISNLTRVTSFGILLPFMLYGLILALLRRSPKDFGINSSGFILLFFAVLYTGVHVLSWTLIRYRLPIDAVMLPFAASALTDLFKRITAHSSQLNTNNKPA